MGGRHGAALFLSKEGSCVVRRMAPMRRMARRLARFICYARVVSQAVRASCVAGKTRVSLTHTHFYFGMT